MPPRFMKSTDTRIVEQRLRDTKPGDIISYEELSRLLGRDVRKYCGASLQTARKNLIGESVFFDTVRNTGVIRLDAVDAVKAADHYTARARRAASRGIRHLSHIEFDALDDGSKRQHLAKSAQLGAVQLFSSGKANKKIGDALPDTLQPVALGDTLKLFGG